MLINLPPLPALKISGNSRAFFDPVDDVSQGEPEPFETHADPLEMFRNTPPVYIGTIKVLRWANTSSQGMSMTVELLDVDPVQSHPFKGMRAARASATEGRRLYTVLSYPDDHPSLPKHEVYTGETVLVWWAEDCAEGMKTILKFREGPDGIMGQHPCDGMATGKKDGEVINMTVWAMADDETLEHVEKGKKQKRRFHELPLTTQSHILSGNPTFGRWARENFRDYVESTDNARHLEEIMDEDCFAEVFIKIACKIQSRAEFNDTTEIGDYARDRWRKMVADYEKYKWSY